jgi:outer membrane protein OmpA-like peptidoglycan-associated protein
MNNIEGVRNMRASLKGIAVLSLALALAGCGSYSRDVAKDGRSAGQLDWPAPRNMPSLHEGGTFPNLDNLRLIKSGIDKHQIAELIGFPHFDEGVWGVREWNYLFNFRKPGSDEVVQCQYKILFDEEKLARSFYWKPESCAKFLERAEPVAAAVAEDMPQRITLAADALFAFDKVELTPDGKAAVTNLGAKLRAHMTQIQSIRVAGYTDRLGTHAYNQPLSERRARAVMDALVADGVPRTKILAEGLGEKDPVKDCPDAAHAELVACLAPNRRVEVRVD